MRKNLIREIPAIVFALLVIVYIPSVEAVDTDGDSIQDEFDNCVDIPNIEQRDTNGDGFGNRCDGDFNGDCVVDFLDLSILKANMKTFQLDSDLNGDGTVDNLDVVLYRRVHLKDVGPSGTTSCVLP